MTTTNHCTQDRDDILQGGVCFNVLLLCKSYLLCHAMYRIFYNINVY